MPQRENVHSGIHISVVMRSTLRACPFSYSKSCATFRTAVADTVAARIGVSELIMGLTLIAMGTSIPEIAASAIASLRGERDIAVGNVVGISSPYWGLLVCSPQ